MSQRLTTLATVIAADIAANVTGASAAALGFVVSDIDDLQILIQPMDQHDEEEDRDDGIFRNYTIGVMVRQKIEHTNVSLLSSMAELVLAISDRYPPNVDMSDLPQALPGTGMAGIVLSEKRFFPFYNEEDMSKDYFHSANLLNFRERLTGEGTGGEGGGSGGSSVLTVTENTDPIDIFLGSGSGPGGSIAAPTVTPNNTPVDIII